jgi:hypothetical protein
MSEIDERYLEARYRELTDKVVILANDLTHAKEERDSVARQLHEIHAGKQEKRYDGVIIVGS